ncbi:unnamed protein product [Leptosia nina]|uniref:Uncharacterized protein n=1 Tax=Leptosia nina TaxID=320188 RepID=A0AAV1IST0_9NEOP
MLEEIGNSRFRCAGQVRPVPVASQGPANLLDSLHDFYVSTGISFTCCTRSPVNSANDSLARYNDNVDNYHYIHLAVHDSNHILRWLHKQYAEEPEICN